MKKNLPAAGDRFTRIRVEDNAARAPRERKRDGSTLAAAPGPSADRSAAEGRLQRALAEQYIAPIYRRDQRPNSSRSRTTGTNRSGGTGGTGARGPSAQRAAPRARSRAGQMYRAVTLRVSRRRRARGGARSRVARSLARRAKGAASGFAIPLQGDQRTCRRGQGKEPSRRNESIAARLAREVNRVVLQRAGPKAAPPSACASLREVRALSHFTALNARRHLARTTRCTGRSPRDGAARRAGSTAGDRGPSLFDRGGGSRGCASRYWR